MAQESSPSPTLRSDRWLLAICMGLSLFFWLMIKMGGEYAHTYIIRLEYRLPEGFAFRQKPDDKLYLTVKGSGWNLLKYQLAKKKKKTLSLKITQTKDHTLTPSRLKTQINKSLQNYNLQMESSSPEVLEIHLDSLAQKKVPLLLQAEIKPAPGFYLPRPPLLQPDSVTISGAKSLLATIVQWPTEKVKVPENPKEDQLETSRKIPIKPQAPKDSLLEISPEQLTLLIEVEPLVEKIFFVPVKALHVPNLQDSLDIFPPHVQIKAVVGASHLDSLEAGDFEVIADFAQIQPGPRSQQTTIALQWGKKPEYVRSADFSPKAIEFTFHFKGKK